MVGTSISHDKIIQKPAPVTRREFLAGSAAATVGACSSGENGREFDVVVYSGTPGGIAAAVTAARMGARVLLAEPTLHVGGMSTSGVNTGETNHLLEWTIGGFALEFYRLLGERYGLDGPEFFFESNVAQQIYDRLLSEAGVEVRYSVRPEQVRKDGARIKAIALSDGSAASAPVFVDASYEGDLMARAGVDYTFGRESCAEFGEEAAGVRFDKVPRKARTIDASGALLPGISGWRDDLTECDAHPGVICYNFRVTVTRDPKFRVPMPSPERYDRNRYQLLVNWLADSAAASDPVHLRDIMGFLRRRNSKFELNNKQSAIYSIGHFGGQFDWPDADYVRRDEIFQDHLDYTLGLFQFLATDDQVPTALQHEMQEVGLHREEFVDNGHFPYQLYVREARRMRGAYVMRQQDVQEDRRKPDSVAMSSHFIDSHHVQRLAVSPEEFVNEGRIWRLGYAYQIPYRSLVPRREECMNLIVPCASSFTHVAFCSFRLESVWMGAGHAAGVAAFLASREDRAVQDVDLAALQAALREQKQVIDFVPGAPEKCTDLNGPPEF